MAFAIGNSNPILPATRFDSAAPAASEAAPSGPVDSVTLGSSHTIDYFRNRGSMGQVLDSVRDALGGCSQLCRAQGADRADALKQLALQQDIQRQVEADNKKNRQEMSDLVGGMLFPQK